MSERGRNFGPHQVTSLSEAFNPRFVHPDFAVEIYLSWCRIVQLATLGAGPGAAGEAELETAVSQLSDAQMLAIVTDERAIEHLDFRDRDHISGSTSIGGRSFASAASCW